MGKTYTKTLVETTAAMSLIPKLARVLANHRVPRRNSFTRSNPCVRAGPELSGGGGGIRTPETLSSLTVFKTAGFNRSPTPPLLILTHLSGECGFAAALSLRFLFLIAVPLIRGLVQGMMVGRTRP